MFCYSVKLELPAANVLEGDELLPDHCQVRSVHFSPGGKTVVLCLGFGTMHQLPSQELVQVKRVIKCLEEAALFAAIA